MMKKQKLKNQKLLESIALFEEALGHAKAAETDRFIYAGLCKSFEICFEYCWKHFKLVAQEEGIDVPSPREAIKAAGQLSIVDDVEIWLKFLAGRNHAVHDYLGIHSMAYVRIITDFAVEVD